MLAQPRTKVANHLFSILQSLFSMSTPRCKQSEKIECVQGANLGVFVPQYHSVKNSKSLKSLSSPAQSSNWPFSCILRPLFSSRTNAIIFPPFASENQMESGL